ncbi:DUF814 domain-containing protein [Candidatus Woesearchaeota archaeon]|nr:DUF814 domain-containing protein [Candidatus Woesearchaeota archaeon]
MRITLDIRKSLEENAASYFEVAKKARNKAAGAEKAIERARRSKATRVPDTGQQRSLPKKIRKKAWYEKFKWCLTSNGCLVIAGRDVVTNEVIIKKYTDDHDVVFHTDAAGSPFVVLKTDGNDVPERVLQETADFCASHSKAWKLGLSSAEVYWVNPEQVTKEAKAGEYMGRGSFMVYGTRHYVRPRMGLVAVPYEDKVMIAPEASAKRYHQGVAAKIAQGQEKTSDSAKKVVTILGVGEVDDVLPGLPSGGCSVEKIML